MVRVSGADDSVPKRSQILWTVAHSVGQICLLLVCHRGLLAAERPNILWISCEDISPHLGCYGDLTATTPNLDRLASEGVRYEDAFSCHGVCAPSRTGIITGMYPISLGANHMRSRVALPQHVRLFPEYLRDAGYYCTNNSKTDYNVIRDLRTVWDASSAKAHWKNRPDPKQPFFAVFNLTMTHESKVWPKGWEEVMKDSETGIRHDPMKMNVPAIYPNTRAVREDFARLADVITVMDQHVGDLLRELEAAGLADDTIVMFWSDHGNGLPRAKRWTYDSGSRVPLIVRIPEKYRELAGSGEAGSIDTRMVSLIDLGPTVMSLAGVPIPAHLHGCPFLGPDAHEGHEYIYGARDRLDERFDLVRTVRNRRYRYVRNLMPWRPALQHVAYGEQNETLKEMRRLLAAGELGIDSSQWFVTPRSAEEFYDLDEDPYEVRNLIMEPAVQLEIQKLREECTRWQLSVRDTHLIPELMLEDAGNAAGSRWDALQQLTDEQFGELLQAAVTTSHLRETDANACCKSLSDSPFARWWQVTLMSRAPGVALRAESLRSELKSSEPGLRLAAAAGLVRVSEDAEATACLRQSSLELSGPGRHAAILEIDEAGPALIRQLKSDLSGLSMESEEYCDRLLQHALSQLRP